MEYNLPERKFCSGPKKLATWRLPETLLSQIEKVAEDRGWTVTEVVMTSLDQFCQFYEKGQKGKSKKK